MINKTKGSHSSKIKGSHKKMLFLIRILKKIFFKETKAINWEVIDKVIDFLSVQKIRLATILINFLKTCKNNLKKDYEKFNLVGFYSCNAGKTGLKRTVIKSRGNTSINVKRHTNLFFLIEVNNG